MAASLIPQAPFPPRAAALASALASALAGLLLSGAAAAADTSWRCDVRSGPRTAALVELYTSEGCSSCPPADAQLSRLSQALDAQAAAVPISLHVAYWDYIGWADPYAQPAFAQRHRALVQANGQRTVYTPHYFVSGREVRDWRGTLKAQVRRTNATPAQADIRVRSGLQADGSLGLDVQASGRAAGASTLFVAITESALHSRVSRGENAGSTLGHDHVVRTWLSPVPLRDGAASLRHVQVLPDAWQRGQLGVVAFVQAGEAGDVLQAVAAQGCAAQP